MRVRRLKMRKRNQWIQLTILSISILFVGLFFLPNVQSKENNQTGDDADGIFEEPQIIGSFISAKHSGRNVYNYDKQPANDILPNEPSKPVNNDKYPTETDKNSQKEDSEDMNQGKTPPNNEDASQDTTKDSGKKTVYLTFDDGPQGFTTDILNILDKYQAKATFFMLEPQMRLYPEIVNDMVKRGHQIALHSVTHDKNKFYQSEFTVVNEMHVGQSTLESITGIKTHLIRTPYGSNPYMTAGYRQAVKNAGFYMWDWNVDSRDWALTDGSFVQYTIDQINKFNKNEPMVILLHDRKTTLEHLESLLIFLTNKGYTMSILNTELVPVQFSL